MTAYLTGVVQAPLTSFVIVSEMTENHALVIPIMLASLVAQGASRLVCPEGVYHALSTQFMPTSRLDDSSDEAQGKGGEPSVSVAH